MNGLTLMPLLQDTGIAEDTGEVRLDGATWYTAAASGDAMEFELAPGALASYRWLTADALLDGQDLVTFMLVLADSKSGLECTLRFGLLNGAQARIRIPLAAVDQSRWQLGREGAFLKPRCGGDALDLERVDRIHLVVRGLGTKPATWCMTPLTACIDEPPLLSDPILSQGPLCDGFGQATFRKWPGKTRSEEELCERLHALHAAAGDARRPDDRSPWGGWANVRFDATGFFRTHHDGRRWWLVDPTGCAFWSMGPDCVRPDIPSYINNVEKAYAWLPPEDGPFAPVRTSRTTDGRKMAFADFLRANLIRAFGKDWRKRWSDIAVSQLIDLRFNTIGNWSDCEHASAAGFPYVRQMNLKPFADVPCAFRDLVDVFDPSFEPACRAFAARLSDTAADPALIGYFLMNEPTWGFAGMTPAEGMLRNCPPNQHVRRAFAAWLCERYTDNDAFAAAWGPGATLDAVTAGPWQGTLSTDAAAADLAAFSSIMVERLYKGMSDACRAVDPSHLNLGCRYYTVPPQWAVAGMKQFDVFSINAYKNRFPSDLVTKLACIVGVPVLIGEWHFGALDVGTPGAALRRVHTQADRGRAYRVYAEAALAHPDCVGIHWFTMYDEPTLGRFDGENWNTGFFDVCHGRYEELAAAARETHERMYPLAAGELEPYDADVPDPRTNAI